VTPALAIASELRNRHPEAQFLYVGVRGKAETSMVPHAWKAWHEKGRASWIWVRSRGFPGLRNPLALARFCWDLGLGTLASTLQLLRFRPDAIVATGGYASAPVIFAVWFLRKLWLSRAKVFVHEQNAVLGRLNRVAVTMVADKVGLAFPTAGVPASKAALVGYPVRAEVARVGEQERSGRPAARESLDLPQDAAVIFAFGGSQGARTINRAVADALPLLLADPRVHVLHGTGRQAPGSSYDGTADTNARLAEVQGLPDDWQQRYRQYRFIEDMPAVYAASDLVICRGGAGSVKEVAACGLAMVVIPKADLAGDYQAATARAMEREGAARVIYEQVALEGDQSVPFVGGDELAEVLQDLLKDGQVLVAMGREGKRDFNPHTLQLCADLVESLLGLHEAPQLPELPPLPEDRVMGKNSNQLLALLQGAHGGRLDALNDEERRAARYKLDGLLTSSSWVMRCRGCRAVGWGVFSERLPVLLAYAAGKTASGDYRELPMVRRDAFLGIGLAGDTRPEVVETLEKGLQDPYFEARSHAAGAAVRLARANGDPEGLSALTPALLGSLGDSDFETRQACVHALAEVGRDAATLLSGFRTLWYDPVWMVRQALIEAYTRLVERELISPKEAAREGNEVLRTSTGYMTQYPLKQAFNALPGRELLTGPEA